MLTTPLIRYYDLKARKIVRNRQTLANWIRREGFPPGRVVGPNTRAWTEDEVAEWLDSRPAGGPHVEGANDFNAPKKKPRRRSGRQGFRWFSYSDQRNSTGI